MSKRLFILPPFEPFDVFVLLLRMVDYPQIPNYDPHFEQNRPQSRRGEPRRPFCVSLLCNVWWQTITWLLLLFLYYILALRVVVLAAEYVCISIQSCTHPQECFKRVLVFSICCNSGFLWNKLLRGYQMFEMSVGRMFDNFLMTLHVIFYISPNEIIRFIFLNNCPCHPKNHHNNPFNWINID